MNKRQQCVMVEGKSTNPYENLAYEECLTDFVAEHPELSIFYLWQNKDSVILGRNQNIYREINLFTADLEHVLPVRRKTGGGAVFHDLGNLNYTVITEESVFRKDEITGMILKALQHDFGIKAYASGRNDLCIGEYKFSGNAYLKKGNIVLNHGTLMINVDIEKMYRCLTPDSRKLEIKGIHSVKSRVMNLSSFNESMCIGNLKESLFSHFQEECRKKKISMIPEIEIDAEVFQDLSAYYSSRDWIYGSIHPTGKYYRQRFAWGTVQIGIFCDEGRIRTCVIDTDALETDVFYKISDQLEGMTMSKDKLIQLAEAADSRIEQDVYKYLADSIGDENERI